jgi:isocitrate/isopropylmalate dehydrogenase
VDLRRRAAITNLKQVVVIAGEGIGPEVIGETRRVLDWWTPWNAHPDPRQVTAITAPR